MTSDTSARIGLLDALRGLMALCVAVYHFAVWTLAFAPYPAASSVVAALGIFSVESFFVLSGVCFFTAYARTPLNPSTLGAFHIRRFFRIAPLYYVALLLNFVLSQNVGPSFTWTRLVENLTLTFGLVHPNHSMVLGGWSIGIEYVFYLVLPLLLWVCRIPGALVALVGVAIALAWPSLSGSVPEVPLDQKFHGYVQVSNHLFLFLVGALIARWRQHTTVRIHALSALLGAAVVLVTYARHLPLIEDHYELMTGPNRVAGLSACTLLVVLAAFTRAPAGAVGSALRWLGDVSYAVYLLHPFAWLVTQRLNLTSPSAALLVGLACTLALAATAHVVLERPLTQYGRRLALHP